MVIQIGQGIFPFYILPNLLAYILLIRVSYLFNEFPLAFFCISGFYTIYSAFVYCECFYFLIFDNMLTGGRILCWQIFLQDFKDVLRSLASCVYTEKCQSPFACCSFVCKVSFLSGLIYLCEDCLNSSFLFSLGQSCLSFSSCCRAVYQSFHPQWALDNLFLPKPFKALRSPAWHCVQIETPQENVAQKFRLTFVHPFLSFPGSWPISSSLQCFSSWLLDA